MRDARREAGALKDENLQLVADAEKAQEEAATLREEISVLGERVVDAQRALDSLTDKSREEAATLAAQV